MDPNTRIAVFVIFYLALTALACGSGYWLRRLHPVRFKGEKVLIGVLTGGFIVLATYGVQKLIGGGVQPLNALIGIAFCLLQGISSEIAVQRAVRRRNKQL